MTVRGSSYPVEKEKADEWGTCPSEPRKGSSLNRSSRYVTSIRKVKINCLSSIYRVSSCKIWTSEKAESVMERFGDCDLCFGDCREIAPTLDYVDAIVTRV